MITEDGDYLQLVHRQYTFLHIIYYEEKEKLLMAIPLYQENDIC